MQRLKVCVVRHKVSVKSHFWNAVVKDKRNDMSIDDKMEHIHKTRRIKMSENHRCNQARRQVYSLWRKILYGMFKFFWAQQNFGATKNCRAPWLRTWSHNANCFFLIITKAGHNSNVSPTTYRRCCDRKGKCAKLHTVAASNNRDHAPQSIYYCLFAPHIYGCYSSRTSRSWWISPSTQRQSRGCNRSMTLKSSRFAARFQEIGRPGSVFLFLRWFKLTHIYVQVERIA